MARILAIDYGTKRTGVAVSDPLQLIAGGLETVPTHQLDKWLAEYMLKNEVSTIVVGEPMKLNSAPSDTWKEVQRLAARLRTAYPQTQIELYDERFTSVLAQRTILESGIGKMARRNKALVDKISATIILQDYMSRQNLQP